MVFNAYRELENISEQRTTGIISTKFKHLTTHKLPSEQMQRKHTTGATSGLCAALVATTLYLQSVSEKSVSATSGLISSDVWPGMIQDWHLVHVHTEDTLDD